jgi:hypothetical protein
MSSITVPELILNMDATQFKVGGNATDDADIIIEKGLNNKNKKCKPIDRTNKGISAYYINYYLIMTARGMTSLPIFLLADASMDPEMIDVINNNNCQKLLHCFHKNKSRKSAILLLDT